jgi:hypothetical protein
MMALGRPPAGLIRRAETPSGAEPAFSEVARDDVLPLSDALTMARITGMTREYAQRDLDIRRADVFSLTDLRRGPAILVGAFNNSWTIRLNKDLRFSFD